MTAHQEAVARISATVKQFFNRKESFRIFHGSNNSTRPPHREHTVDISALSKVLKVNVSTQTAIVEPNVPMDKLLRATLAHGLIPPVVMEFPGITVGGGFAGSAGESSSFKYGYFDQTVNSIELVLATGEVVTASKTTNADLFKGSAGAMGTLGITTLLELQLVPARRFVKLGYRSFHTIAETTRALREATEDTSNDYVDGIIYSRTHGVLLTGKLTDEIPFEVKPQTFSSPSDPWFYIHARHRASAKEHAVDYVPIADYLFRYDREGFWVGAEAFNYFGFVPFNRFTRWFLDDFMHTRMMFRALHASNMSFGQMIHDVSLPYPSVERFIDYAADSLDIWPLWLCPLRAIEPPSFHPYTSDVKNNPQPMLNIGLWGAAKSKDLETFVRQNRDLETRLTELGGRKVLYSHTYYAEDEFWALYDEKWYRDLRAKYQASSLPTVYEKAKVDVSKQRSLQRASLLRRLATTWPFAGFIGIWHAIKSRDYLIHRDLKWMRWRY